jgi:hypothetical protein
MTSAVAHGLQRRSLRLGDRRTAPPRPGSSTRALATTDVSALEWIMSAIQIEAVEDPFTDPGVARSAGVLLGRAESMGLLDDLGTISRLDGPLMTAVLQRLGKAGLLQRAVTQGSVRSLPTDAGDIAALLRAANTALEDSPLPPQEWPSLRAILGDALLTQLCGISEVSLRRYAAGVRPTPDLVAQRLHVLALMVADLRGAYNEYGIRRWFQRPRAQLGGRAPAELLAAGWTLDSPDVRQLRELAEALTGSPAT